jgi:hypothetical protein
MADNDKKNFELLKALTLLRYHADGAATAMCVHNEVAKIAGRASDLVQAQPRADAKGNMKFPGGMSEKQMLSKQAQELAGDVWAEVQKTLACAEHLKALLAADRAVSEMEKTIGE